MKKIFLIVVTLMICSVLCTSLGSIIGNEMATAQAGVIPNNPAVSQNADGRLEVFAIGTDGALWHIWQATPGGAWSNWASLSCAFSISPTSQSIDSSGGTGSITVTPSSNSCTWSATATDLWITITSGSSGKGSGSVSYSGSANTSTSSRTGTITVAGQTFTVIQSEMGQYALTVTTSGTGSGTVTANSGTISWSGSTGTASYGSGTSVTLTATASSGSTFTKWTGCDTTNGNTCTVSMTSAKSVTATFTPKAAGTILVGAPNPSGSYFGMYGGDLSAAEFTLSASEYVATIDVMLLGDSSYNAIYDFSLQNSLTGSITTFASAVLTAPNTGLNTEVMTVNATLQAGTYYLVGIDDKANTLRVPGWYVSNGTLITNSGTVVNGVWGSSSPDGPWSLLEGVENGYTYDAPTFIVNGSPAPPAATNQLTVIDTGSGTVTANPGTLIWSVSTGTASYSTGTSVKLTATPASGSTFTSWTGCDSTSGNTCTISMTAARNVTATFTSIPPGPCTYSISPASSAATFGATGGSGTITLTPSSTTCNQEWVATSVSPWLTFEYTCSTGICYNSNVSGIGSGTISYKVAANTGTSNLTYNINISVLKLPFVVTEQGNSCISCNITFADVTAADTFRDYISSIACAGITQGCGNGNYCPADDVSRAEMAAFIVRAKEGEPPADYCTAGSIFNDVSSSDGFCKYIKRLSELQITTGCGGGDYCPDQNVTRGEMAAFIIRALYGENFTCTGGVAGAAVACSTTTPYFSDVPSVTADQFFPYIQKLKELEITTGCGNGDYCPSEYVTRDQMAAFLFRAFQGSSCPTTACTTAAISVTVTDSTTGKAIQGATVTAGTETMTTGGTGMASVTGLLSTQNQTTPITINVTAGGYTAGTTGALLSCGTTTAVSVSLVPATAGTTTINIQ